MCVVTAEIIDVQRDVGVIDETLKKFVEQIDIKSPMLARSNFTLYSMPGRPEKSTTTRDKASSSGT